MADSEPIHFNRTYPAAPHDVPPVLPQYSDQKTSRPSCHCRICAMFMCVVVIFVILGAAAFLALYVLRPRAVTYFVEDAYLSEFNLTSKGTLQCNLKLDVSITNPNMMFGVYYQKLDASAYYDEELIGWVFLPTFYLGRNRTVSIHPVFGGQSVIGLNGLRVSDSMKQRSDGFYSIDIEIHAKMRLKFGALMTDKFCQKIWCELMVPLMPSSNSAFRNGEFTRTECKVEYLDWFFPFKSLQGL
ncbi:NDR1/HIN1-like protein 10 [Nymphaea colorata]|uniref:NDR1/HIN1-like protein 10 n=1 Tax=Nymphaea colorata TaxID=210225 RepID=UPI00129E2DF3|nr:NDR1/HIN1-like protein 10 [Nymphaea colorata]